MTVYRVREYLHARPFHRFVLHLADGRALPVDHPELMALAPSGRTAVVVQKDDSTSIIDLMLVTELTVGGPRKRTRSQPRRAGPETPA
jgi:hypothetical protein